MLTATQQRTAQAIVNIFETSAVLGKYGQVTALPGDAGHLSYGRSQATLGSGSLHDLLRRYCENPGARFGARLTQALGRFAAADTSLDRDWPLHNVLRAAADDPVMRDTQDAFFEHRYWRRAERAAARLGVTTPLGVAVIYDSTVHGSLKLVCDRTNGAGSLADRGERRWIADYVRTRRAWLAQHRRKELRATVYRMEAFARLVEQGYFGLELPLVVRDLEISTLTLHALPADCYDGPRPGSRMLEVQTPLLRGLDVRLVQLGLSDRGIKIKADGIFGNTSAGCVRNYQKARGLPPTGVADAALIAELVPAA